MEANLPFISIIVPVHNSRDHLAESLSSLRQSDYPRFELIIVDNGSRDGSIEIAKGYADTFIALEEKTGPARARNIGASKSKGEVLFFVDADVKVARDTVSKVAKAMSDDRETAAIFGSYDTDPPALDFFSRYKNLSHHFIHQHAKERSSTFWGACGAVRKEVFMETGGFPERYPYAAIEDVEFGYAISSRGGKIRLIKEIQVTHLKRWSIISVIKTDIAQRAIPWTRLAFEKGGIPYDLNFKLADRIGGAVSICLCITFVLMWRWRPLALLFLALQGLLLYLNREFYAFFYTRRGVLFAAGGVLFHWFYLFYSSIIYICVSFTLFLKKCRHIVSAW